MITSEHAEKRMQQITEICLRQIQELEEEKDTQFKEAEAAGFNVELEPVVLLSTDPNSVFWVWNRYLEFYSQFL